MKIIGCDYHPSWQHISWADTLTGEMGEEKLDHASGAAGKLYRQLPGPALIGMESTGNCQWFVGMATTARHQVWIGDAAKIRASEVRQQKNLTTPSFLSTAPKIVTHSRLHHRLNHDGKLTDLL